MPRPAHPLVTEERIVAAALRLAEADGDFTVAAIARDLGVQAASIYHHVTGKREVIELVRRELHRRLAVPVDTSGPWREVVRAFAIAQRAEMSRYFWLIPLLATSPATVDDALSAVENLATVLRRAGFPYAHIDGILGAVDLLVIGGSIDASSPNDLFPRDVVAPHTDLAAAVHAGEVELRAEGPDADRAQHDFLYALDLLLDALELRLHRVHEERHGQRPAGGATASSTPRRGF